jgi:hypothetical protein
LHEVQENSNLRHHLMPVVGHLSSHSLTIMKLHTVFLISAIITGVASAAITFDFDDGTLQGWHNRVWNGSGWIDLAPNAATYAGTILPASDFNGLFVPGANDVWVSGNMDEHLNTLWLRSPEFILNGFGDLTVQLAKGIARTTAPANDRSVPFAAISGGWMGVALRRTSDGAFVLTKSKTQGPDDTYYTSTFTQGELAPFVSSATYTLELINSGNGGWGWVTMDNVVIPGSVIPEPSAALHGGLGLFGLLRRRVQTRL